MNTLRAKCLRRTPKDDRQIALVMAAHATLLDNPTKAVCELKQAINLIWKTHPLVWFLLIQVLRRMLEQQQEIADGLRQIQRPLRPRHGKRDFILSPELWGLRFPGQQADKEDNA